MPEFADAPANLRQFIPRIRQRQNHVIIHLRNRVAMSVVLLDAFAVGLDNAAIRAGIVLF